MTYVPLKTLRVLAVKARRYDEIADRVKRRARPAPRWLTPRRREVLVLTCQELTREETAERLGVGVETIKMHRKTLMRLTRSRTLVGLSLWAVRHGIVDP